jgi:hypothetical protein
MSLKIYNADEVTAAFGPVLIESGLADGEFLRIEQESDDISDVAGTDGEVAASRTNDRRATVTIILMQTSSSNDQLSVLSNLAKTAPGMAGAVHPLLIKDRNGRAIYTAQNAWISKAPDVSFDRTATAREWTIRCANLIRVDGGS